MKNKVIVITGASQGLGKSLARKLAVEGAQVALVARSENLLNKLQLEMNEAGGKSEYFVCDIRNLESVQKTVQEIYAKFRRIDILVNNAGIWTDNDLEEKNPHLRKDAFETNALGNIQFTQEVLPHFQEQNSGHILNVISSAGALDSQGGHNQYWQTYTATKWAMTGFTKVLRESVQGTHIKVTGFFPGGFDSNLYENADRKDAHDQFWMMKTDDVTDIILFALTRPDDVLVESLIVTKAF